MTHYRVILAMIGMAVFVACGSWPGQADAQVNVDVGPVHVHIGDNPPPPPQAVEVLTRGPVHEAFAQPVTLDAETGFTIPRRPPAVIEEVPPDQRPEGGHIVWIPGYWGWDGDRSDFIWVSGCWRAVPPNTSWVPGYWAQVRGGYQWIAGFWTAADTQEIEYLPAPPATLEAGPQGTPASADSVWIPGCWVRNEGRYAWRPGFWEAARADWVWEPAHYVTTPRGWVYVDGYWDYPLNRRGLAFLPMYAPPSLYGRSDFRYTPEIVLDLDGLTANLFISPERHQYYFGDYYGAEYASEDFYPWYAVRDHHDWYDPTFVHEQWTHRDDRKWADNQRTEYEHRRTDTAIRPARTYEAMRAQVARLPEKDRRQVQVARPMTEVVAAKTTPYKFDTLDAKTREATVTHAKDVHAYQDKRSQWEAPSVAPKAGPEPRVITTPKEVVAPREVAAPREPVKVVAPPETPARVAVVRESPAPQDVTAHKVVIPKSPVVVREYPKELAPPPRPVHPQPDLKAQPMPPKSVAPAGTETPKK